MSLVLRSHIKLSVYRKNYRNLWTGGGGLRGFSNQHLPYPPLHIFMGVICQKYRNVAYNFA